MLLFHHTVETKHTAFTPRSDVTDDVIELLIPWIKDGLESQEPIPIPTMTEYFVTLKQNCLGALVANVRQIKNNETLYLVGFMVYKNSNLTPRYKELAKGCDACVVNILEGLTWNCEAIGWLGDFERCVAWAYLQTDLWKN